MSARQWFAAMDEQLETVLHATPLADVWSSPLSSAPLPLMTATALAKAPPSPAVQHIIACLRMVRALAVRSDIAWPAYAKPLVLVVTSEKSWQKLSTHCFNENFTRNRAAFDLAVVFNGFDAAGVEYVKKFKPEYFFTRPNVGLDLAGFDFLIKNVKLENYKTFLFLHDDHYFIDDRWPLLLHDILQANDVDVLGNIIDRSAAVPNNFRVMSYVLGYAEYQLEKFPYFLQGLAGIYKKKAIEVMVAHDGIPHFHSRNRELSFVAERLHSFVLLGDGIKFGQIPPGCQEYLIHGQPNS